MYINRLLDIQPEDKEARLLAGTIAVRMKKFDKATEEFSAAFSKMSDGEMDYYNDISPLLSGETRELYTSSSRIKRKEINRRFWCSLDPTAGTTLNEKKLEHYARVYTAEKLFSVKGRMDGAYSDRGKVLIRFGPPDSISFDLGEGQSGPELKWFYTIEDKTVVTFTFVDEFLNGDFHFPLEDLSGEFYESLYNGLQPRYTYPFQFSSIPMHISVYQFRDENGRLKIEHWIALPDSFGDESDYINMACTIYDDEFNILKNETEKIELNKLSRFTYCEKHFILVPYPVHIPPIMGGILSSIEVVNQRKMLRSTSRLHIDLKDLWGSRLMISSVKLELKSVTGECLNAGDPIKEYSRGENICIEYAVYNLSQNKEGKANYTVSYRIDQPKANDTVYAKGLKSAFKYIINKLNVGVKCTPPIVTNTFNLSVDASSTRDRLIIETDKLKPGVYRLTVSVSDSISASNTQEAVAFTIIE